ncbi:MAG TPA: double-strand break repair protein AddB [Parvibaculum sp.]
MPHDSPRLFTIPAGTPFLDALAATLLADPSLGGRFGRNVALADVTILLPTRRAARALGDAFLRAGEGAALILPAIRPLGDVDEDELVLAPALGAGASLALPPSISPLERQMRLARLILDHWTAADENADIVRAFALAADLGRFLDMALTERVALENLARLVPDEYAAHWQITVEFLKLLTERWPAELAALGMTDEAERRNLLIDAQRAQWQMAPPVHPVLAAGSTGSIPATGELLALIARLPLGAVVLPGLDTDLDEQGWDAVEPSHPQYGMKQLLHRMGAARDDVALWPGIEVTPRAAARAHFLSSALRPARTTEQWQRDLGDLKAHAGEALSGLTLVEAPTARDEAVAIALMLRETLETPGKTAALVTPDRGLARRVASELHRWKIDIDDSAGLSLALTPPVAFLRLVAEAAAEHFAPIALLACLKHPFASLGRAHLRADIRRLDEMLLRGPRPAPGFAGLRAALAEAHDDPRLMDREKLKLAGLDKLIDAIEAAFAPFIALLTAKETPLADLVRAHCECAERIADTKDIRGDRLLWQKEDGEAASGFMQELIEKGPAFGAVDPRSYARLFSGLAAPRVVRPRFGRHPRLFIWGPLEARLQHADRIVLGALNERTWPAEANIDPWLNRPMRKELDLEPPERRIGLAAHDFVEGASAPEAILTRALKVDGAPTVASRWLLRLQGLLKGVERDKGLAAPVWSAWAQALDWPETVTPARKPAPRPPLTARPARLSVTEIETLIRDPYSIYARRILQLRVLDPIDADVAAAERGTIIHAVLEAFTRAHPAALPANAREELLRIGRDIFAGAMERPGVAAFWWPRFERIADWIAARERDWRANMALAHAEMKGEVEIPVGPANVGRKIVLSGRADRIDEMKDGTLAIVDYKTGMPPSARQVEIGLAPQLPLEAAMAERGGFPGLAPRASSALLYLRLTGGEKAGELRNVGGDGLVEKTWARLLELLAQYEEEATPYRSRPRPMFASRFAEYDHLARVREWSASGGEGE